MFLHCIYAIAERTVAGNAPMASSPLKVGLIGPLLIINYNVILGQSRGSKTGLRQL